MKNIITILFAVLLLAPISVDAKNNTKREINRAVKQKMKEYKKEGWVTLSSEPLKNVLKSHFEKLDIYGGACLTFYGDARDKASVSIVNRRAKERAFADFAEHLSSEIESEMTDLVSSDENSDSNVNKFASAIRLRAKQEIRGIMQESYTIYRQLDNGIIEVRTYYLVLDEAIRRAKVRARENTLKELGLN
jgi:hypothetical protein